MDCQRAEAYIVEQLRQHLPAALYYHGLHHTLDVVEQAQSLAEAEGLTDSTERALLRTAAFYHDAGFLTTYQGHEAAGCALVQQKLPAFGYSATHIDFICQLIMATQVPQSPGTLLPAQILCDADLDYLGRPDFWPISHSLRDELTARGLLESEQAWQRLQLSFLQQHHYWTISAQHRRETAKQSRISEVKALLDTLLL